MALSPNEALHSYEALGIPFAGGSGVSTRRQLVFDHVVDPKRPSPRDVFDAVARSLRDHLAQRWFKTPETHDRERPRHVQYLSIEVLLGRSLINTITTLMFEPLVQEVAQQNR